MTAYAFLVGDSRRHRDPRPPAPRTVSVAAAQRNAQNPTPAHRPVRFCALVSAQLGDAHDLDGRPRLPRLHRLAPRLRHLHGLPAHCRSLTSARSSPTRRWYAARPASPPPIFSPASTTTTATPSTSAAACAPWSWLPLWACTTKLSINFMPNAVYEPSTLPAHDPRSGAPHRLSNREHHLRDDRGRARPRR